MLISYENKKDKNHIYLEVHCNFFERLKYLFTNKINFIFNTELIKEDDLITVCGKKMTYKPYKK